MWIALITNTVIRIPASYIIAYLTRSAANPAGHPTSAFLALDIAMLLSACATLIYYRMGRWKNKSTVFTSQLNLEGIVQLIGEGAVGNAIVDRLLNPSKIVTLKGESKR